MKTLKKEVIVDGKTNTEYCRVKNDGVSAREKLGYKLCSKVPWKAATKGYKEGGKGKEVKREVDITDGLKKKQSRN